MEMESFKQFLNTEHDGFLDEASRNLIVLLSFVGLMTTIVLSLSSLFIVIPTYLSQDVEIMQSWWYPYLLMWTYYIFSPCLLYLIVGRPLLYMWRCEKNKKIQ